MTEDPSPSLSGEERREVGRELAKAWRGIDAMRIFFWSGAVVGAIGTLVASGAWSIGIGVFAATAAAGALQVRRKPALWAIIVAVVATPFSVVLFVVSLTGGSPKGLIGAVGLLIGAWMSVRVMIRAERLVKAHPNHFGARRISGKVRRKRR